MSLWNTELFAQTSDIASATPDAGHPVGQLVLLGIGLMLLAAFLAFVVQSRKPRPTAKDTAEPKPIASDTSVPLATKTAEKAESPQVVSEISEIIADDQTSWLSRLKLGLSKTRNQLNLARLFGSNKLLNEQLLEEVHETLYRSDMGGETADRLVNALKQRFKGETVAPAWEQVAEALRNEVSEVFRGHDIPLNKPADGPLVILVVGVNGVGKTTSIGKLAARFVAEGKSVLLCAADTFRAAAIEQLQVWGERINVPVIRHQQGADPASVAFDGVKAAKSRGVDILLIDTAGRLHSKTELMEELAKVKRVIQKELPGAPHETWLVIDATTGQNAMQQVKAFQEIIQLSGLVITKLDGTAKGGVIIGIRNRFDLPIRYVGVGERAADLKDFSPRDFADSIFPSHA